MKLIEETAGKGTKGRKAKASTPAPKTPRPYRPGLVIEVPEHLRDSVAKIAEAGGYTEGVKEMLLETYVDPDVILRAVAMSLIRGIGNNGADLTPLQIAHVAAVTMEETIRHSEHFADKWVAEHSLGMATA